MNNNELTNLAQNNPKQLVKLLYMPNTDATTLSNAIEILAEETPDESIFLPILKILLKHGNALVREGACSAVSSFYFDRQIPDDILEKLSEMSRHDPSYSIKKHIEDLLSQLK